MIFCVILTSLPTRERGLKFRNSEIRVNCALSLPTRERGLKYGKICTVYGSPASLPTRERGLKCPNVNQINPSQQGRSLRGSVG